MALDLANLSEEDKAQLASLLNKATPTPDREWGQPVAPNPLTITIKRHKDAKEMVDKRARVVSAIGRANLEAGIQSPKRSPMGAAGSDAAQKKYEQSMADKAVLKRRQDNVRKVTDSDWLSMMERLGLDRYVKGTEEAQWKYERFSTNYDRELSRICAEIDKMPDTTLDERKARAAKMIDELAKLKGKLR